MVDSGVASDNIIGRMYNLIYALKNAGGSNSENAFCKVFSLEENDRASILNNYAELFKMCTIGINEIEQLNPKRLQKYKDTLSDVLDGLSKIYFNANPNARNNGMDKFNDHFSNNLMLSLEHCADYLSENSNGAVIEDGKIVDLLKEINELEQFIISSKLHNELEKIIIYQLNNLRESLLKYKLYGSQGIIDSVATTLGKLILNQEKFEVNKDKGTIERIFGVIVKINSIFTFKNNSTKLVGDIIKKLTGGE
ncbi:hypothetical protein [Paenibacillus sp. F4]|uniref:hypothetical protein n=1 Tax=Paenibacillus sp. F4 TaxID=357385 RepID=UPI000C9EEA89|nr:hypothetical protein [Paenibacillus sp. F4]PNQ80774.1 hypothetical protein C1T21_11735 [Paenibacillus sp. F4]